MTLYLALTAGIVADEPVPVDAAALQAQVAAHVAAHADQVDEAGHRPVVPNGYHPPREVSPYRDDLRPSTAKRRCHTGARSCAQAPSRATRR